MTVDTRKCLCKSKLLLKATTQAYSSGAGATRWQTFNRRFRFSSWSCVNASRIQFNNYSTESGSGPFAQNQPASNSSLDEAAMKKMKVKAKPGNMSNPTVFFDSLRIYVKAGGGGQGLPKKGGIGGSGGDVIAVGHKNVSLKHISSACPTRRFVATTGADAKLFCLIGEPAKHVFIPVPVGVQVFSEHGQKLGEINKHGEKLVLAKGGVGACAGNGFSSEEGQKHSVTLDLKLIADVGFVGFPNAGKSTLLKSMSRASPKIASYPFTTVRPNVGVVEYPDLRQISLADLPGLIEGAHTNVGMGHAFLKHVERTKVLLFVVDIFGFQLRPDFPQRTALETIVLLNRELELYKEELTEKPAILLLNKFDLPGSYDIIQQIKDIVRNRRAYEKFLKKLPSEFVPDHLMQFEQVIPISAKKDPLSVNQVKTIIRQVIDRTALQQSDTSSHVLRV